MPSTALILSHLEELPYLLPQRYDLLWREEESHAPGEVGRGDLLVGAELNQGGGPHLRESVA